MRKDLEKLVMPHKKNSAMSSGECLIKKSGQG